MNVESPTYRRWRRAVEHLARRARPDDCDVAIIGSLGFVRRGGVLYVVILAPHTRFAP